MSSTLHHSAYDYGSPIGSVWDQPSNPAPRGYGRLEGSETCDVVIIGAGIVGLSAAYHLATDYRAQVIVLDAANPGWGSSGRSLGLCTVSPMALYQRLLGENGKEPAKGLPTASAVLDADLEAMALVSHIGSSEGFQTQKAGDGLLIGGKSPAELVSMENLWAQIDPENSCNRQLLQSDALRENFLNSPYLAGVLSVSPGFSIDPLHYTYRLAEACERAGVRIYGGTRVREISEKTNWVSVRYRGGTLSAANAVVATNALTRGRAIPELADRMLHVMNHAVATRPLSDPELSANGLGQPMTLRIEDEVRGPLQLRVLPDRRVVMSSMVTLNADPARAADVRLRLRSQFLRVLPGLRDVHISHSWRVFGGRTKDALPFVGPLSSRRRLLYAGGLEFDSVSLSTWLGRNASDYIANSDDVRGRAFVSSDPMPKIRFAGIRGKLLARKINQSTQASA
jgi:glycine/D-amino acid oxidase-like deaminating enzyme